MKPGNAGQCKNGDIHMHNTKKWDIDFAIHFMEALSSASEMDAAPTTTNHYTEENPMAWTHNAFQQTKCQV